MTKFNLATPNSTYEAKTKDYFLFCKNWLEAWTGNRPKSLIAFYSEDAFYRDPGNVSGLCGHKEILPYFEKLLSKNPEWKWEATEIIPTEKGFILKWHALISVGPQVVEKEGLDIVELDHQNKITRNEVYFDPRMK